MEIFITSLMLLSGAATFAIMFSGVLRIRPRMLRRLRRNPRLFLRTLAVIWIAVPAFTILVILALRVTGQSAALLLLMSSLALLPFSIRERRYCGACRPEPCWLY